MTRRIVCVAALCALGMLSPAGPVSADEAAPPGGERILAIDSDVQVLPDRTLRVQETIRIRSAGQQFKHGLERDFPQTYAGPFGSRAEVGFQIEEVLLDGAPEPFRLRRSRSDAVLRAGQRDVLLEPGEHTYRITYVTDRQLGFFADHDELYWNAVGTRWRLTVDQATATITLPPAAQGQVRAATAYIGGSGSRERAKLASIEPFGGKFEAGRPLRPGEGLTVVVEWPKGLITAPTSAMRFGWWLRDNRDSEVAVFGIVLLLIFLRATRTRLLAAGEDTPLGSGTGTYEGMAALVSPCLLRYVVRRGFDDGSLPIAFLDMAQRGYVTVRQTGAHYRLERTEKPLGALPPEEESVARVAFEEKPALELAPVDAKRLSVAKDALKWDLDRLGPRYISDGRSAAALGVLLSLVVVGIALGLGSGDAHIGVFIGLISSGFAMAFFAATGWALRALSGRELKRTNAGGIAAALVFAAIIVMIELAIGDTLAEQVSRLAIGLCVVVLFLGYRAVRLRRLRTRAGEALYREARRARRSTPPTATGGGALDVLPYVMALDAVETWQDGIETLTQVPAPGTERRVHWLYDDPNWMRWRTSPPQWSSFTDEFSSMTEQAAGPPPGSSSGSSAGGSSSSSSSSSSSDSGGSSGGGGGGGGGGGW